MTVDDYFDSAPEPHRSTLMELRAQLKRLLPDAEEGLSYGVPAFKVGGKPVAGYAFFKNHCSYFPHSGSALTRLGDDALAGYEWSKGTLKFSVDQALPDSLVARLVEVRLGELGS